MTVDVTVAMTIHKSERFIVSCVESILGQCIDSFELLVVEDPPFDEAGSKIASFKDDRIRYFRNQYHLGIAKSRNKCVELARGEYVFFTDDDCIVGKDWMEQGLRSLSQPGCIGVEGKTYYVSDEYQPTYSDIVTENKTGGCYNTCNIAYKKSVISQIKGFDERYTYHEDRDLAKRAMKLGGISFNPKMIVYHQKIDLTPKAFVKTGSRLADRALLFKRFRETDLFLWRIAYPRNLITIIFPPLFFGSFLLNKYKTIEDLILFPYGYLRLVYERLSFWRACAKERVFLI